MPTLRSASPPPSPLPPGTHSRLAWTRPPPPTAPPPLRWPSRPTGWMRCERCGAVGGWARRLRLCRAACQLACPPRGATSACMPRQRCLPLPSHPTRPASSLPAPRALVALQHERRRQALNAAVLRSGPGSGHHGAPAAGARQAQQARPGRCVRGGGERVMAVGKHGEGVAAGAAALCCRRAPHSFTPSPFRPGGACERGVRRRHRAAQVRRAEARCSCGCCRAPCSSVGAPDSPLPALLPAPIPDRRAVAANASAMVRLLLESGAHPAIRTRESGRVTSALHLAAQNE
jgi:hypothetical protein